MEDSQDQPPLREGQQQIEDSQDRGLLRDSGRRGSFGCLASNFWWYAGVAWILVVIVSGGGYILTLAGVCTSWSLTQCESFEEMQIQILTAAFTAINLYAFPSRLARFEDCLGSGCVRGCLRDEPVDERSLMAESYDPSSFDALTWSTKVAVSTLLIISSLAQFVNQVFHGIYFTYDDATHWPGDLWDNLFFLLSLATMVAGIIVEGIGDFELRGKHPPGRFKPTAAHVISGWVSSACCAY